MKHFTNKIPEENNILIITCKGKDRREEMRDTDTCDHYQSKYAGIITIQ